MGRALQTSTPVIKNVTVVVPVAKGGTGVSSINSLPAALGIVPKTSIGVPLGVAGSDSNGYVSLSQLPTSAVPGVTIDGPDEIFQNTTVAFTITNYDINTPYNITVSAGLVSRVGATINYSAPASAQSVTMTVNGRPCVFVVKATSPAKPTVTSPVYGSSVAAPNYTFTSSNYTGTVSAHLTSDWQIATDPSFSSVIFQSLNSAVNKVSWPLTGLAAATQYIVRVRHNATDGTVSAWSEPVRFNTN